MILRSAGLFRLVNPSYQFFYRNVAPHAKQDNYAAGLLSNQPGRYDILKGKTVLPGSFLDPLSEEKPGVRKHEYKPRPARGALKKPRRNSWFGTHRQRTRELAATIASSAPAPWPQPRTAGTTGIRRSGFQSKTQTVPVRGKNGLFPIAGTPRRREQHVPTPGKKS